jgi:hypothetical protein
MLTSYINDEQLLELCLSDQASKDYDLEGLSGEILTLYVMINSPDPKSATVEYVEEKLRELVTDYILRKLVEKGLAEVSFNENGEVVYTKAENE